MSGATSRWSFFLLPVCLAASCIGAPREEAATVWPVDSEPVVRREVVFRDGETALAGTLFQPRTTAVRPAVLLLGGAERGPRDALKERMAQAMAQRGVAVLIYDSPGSGDSTGNALLQTRADRAREAIAGVQFLRAQQGIHPARVGVWGTSEGGNIALLAATESSDVAFAVAASGTFGVSPLEVVRYRIEMQGRRRGLSAEQLEKAWLFGEVLFAMLAGPDVVSWQLLEARAARWPDEPFGQLIADVRRCRDGMKPEEETALWTSIRRSVETWQGAAWFGVAVPDPRKFVGFFAADAGFALSYLRTGPFASGDWHASWREYAKIAEIGCPILAVWGERDSFVPPNRSAAALRACLGESQSRDVTIRIIPGASHVFTTGGLSDPFVADYPELIVEWLKERF